MHFFDFSPPLSHILFSNATQFFYSLNPLCPNSVKHERPLIYYKCTFTQNLERMFFTKIILTLAMPMYKNTEKNTKKFTEKIQKIQNFLYFFL